MYRLEEEVLTGPMLVNPYLAAISSALSLPPCTPTAKLLLYRVSSAAKLNEMK